jgi:hypothetical protein
LIKVGRENSLIGLEGEDWIGFGEEDGLELEEGMGFYSLIPWHIKLDQGRRFGGRAAICTPQQFCGVRREARRDQKKKR